MRRTAAKSSTPSASPPVTIIVAETGAGKSTQAPQYFLDAGYRLVVTQPRRMAAELVATRVAEERNTEIGNEVGYRLGGGTHVDSNNTRCLFVTEGLALVRELLSQKLDKPYDILVLDECHEWNHDMEILVAWVRRQLGQGATYKVVLMSATMEAEKLSEYFGGAPIIQVPGRVFPVKTEASALPDSDDEDGVWDPIVRDVNRLVAEGRNVLVFAPGKAEIKLVCDKLSTSPAMVLPLHGDLDKSERKRCFQHYDGRSKVVVSTNVAQTSVTIDDIDAVVDSGLERRTEVSGGVEGLRLRLISKADSDQRKGRAGRTKPGIYIDHANTAATVTPGVGDRETWPKAEILRVLLDQAVLRLAMAGIDLEDLELFHQPSRSEIHGAKETLRALGCLGDGIKVTPLGERVSRLPTSVRSGCMLLAAEERGVLSEVMTIVAIVESGSIVDNRIVEDYSQIPVWKKHITDNLSDHVSMLRIFEKAKGARSNWKAMGLHGKGMSDAMSTRQQLANATTLSFSKKQKGSRDDIVKSVLAGLVDQLRDRRFGRWGMCYGVDQRKLGRDSVVDTNQAAWVVGLPFDISTKKGGTLALLEMSSAVNMEWLAEVAPHLVTIDNDRPRYDVVDDVVRMRGRALFGGKLISSVDVEVTGPKAAEAIAEWIMEIYEFGQSSYTTHLEAYHDALTEAHKCYSLANDLNRRIGKTQYNAGSLEWLRTQVMNAIGSANKLADVSVDGLHIYRVPMSEVIRVRSEYPDRLVVNGVTYDIMYTYEVASARIEESAWRSLPDELVTPGGRVCEVQLGYGWNPERTTDLKALKARLRTKEAGRRFTDWHPRPQVEGMNVVEAIYGETADGAPRVAYGTKGEFGGSYWFENRVDAEKANADMRAAMKAAAKKAAKPAVEPSPFPLRGASLGDMLKAKGMKLAAGK